MLLRLVPLLVLLAACGPGAPSSDAGPDVVAQPDTAPATDSATADATPYACNGPCASGCCENNACINLQADLAHCGTCGHACRTGEVCSHGVCQ